MVIMLHVSLEYVLLLLILVPHSVIAELLFEKLQNKTQGMKS